MAFSWVDTGSTRFILGSFDPVCAIGSLGLLGVWLGVTVAQPLSFVWTAVVLAAFGIFNLLLMQMIFAWLERWLAQRRTREIMGVLFILLMLSFQLIGPAVQHMDGKPHPEFRRDFEIAAQIQTFLPPGLAADAIAKMANAAWLAGIGFQSASYRPQPGSRISVALAHPRTIPW